MIRSSNHIYGFTLIEVAIVLLILATLAGSLLIPLSDSLERSRRKQAENQLRTEILPALMAYAASQTDLPYLPCPDCRDDGGSSCPGSGTVPGDGIEDRTTAGSGAGSCSVEYGALPWATLGVAVTDPWGSRYSYSVDGDYANQNSGVELTGNTPNLEVESGAGGGPNLVGSTNGAAAIILSHGANRYGGMAGTLDSDGDAILFADPPSANADEVENTDGNTVFIMRPPTDPDQNDIEEFDDIVVWLSTYRLRGFLVDAGRLP